jgi:hypothetical protein
MLRPKGDAIAMRRRWIFPVLAAAVVASFPILSATAACHVITFDGDPYSVGESAGKVTITVSKGGTLASPTVDYETVNGTAKAGSDYENTKGTLEIPEGQSEASFDIPINNDSSDESNEQFTVRLKNPGQGGCFQVPTIDEDTATVTIQDNDEKPIAQPTPTPTPTKTSSPKPKPSTASASPSPTLTSPSPTTSTSPIAAAESGDGGLSGGALAGIVAATVALGGAGAFWVRRRFLI